MCVLGCLGAYAVYVCRMYIVYMLDLQIIYNIYMIICNNESRQIAIKTFQVFLSPLQEHTTFSELFIHSTYQF